MHNCNTCPPALCAGEAPDEKLKINELGPNQINTQSGFLVDCNVRLGKAAIQVISD